MAVERVGAGVARTAVEVVAVKVGVLHSKASDITSGQPAGARPHAPRRGRRRGRCATRRRRFRRGQSDAVGLIEGGVEVQAPVDAPVAHGVTHDGVRRWFPYRRPCASATGPPADPAEDPAARLGRCGAFRQAGGMLACRRSCDRVHASCTSPRRDRPANVRLTPGTSRVGCGLSRTPCRRSAPLKARVRRF